jgi:predicted MPP superfamily phosphohydrolase
MNQIFQAIKAKDGIFATLGNHDTCNMVRHFEQMGIVVLINETVKIQRQKDTLTVTGIDDPNCYFTPHAKNALGESGKGFKIILSHTPELYDIAADNGYRLYLCGHTHGGQICLPGAKPIITHLYDGKKFSRGLWRYAGMLGYTNSGCGSVGIPVRYNCPGEIAIIRLKKAEYRRSGTVKTFPR